MLAENQQLKQHLTTLTITNSKLTLDIEEIKNCNGNQQLEELQLEEFENETDIILNKYSILVGKFNQVENQLLIENRIQNDLDKIF